MPLSPEFFHLTEHSRQGVAYCWARACRILAGRAAHVPRLSCWGAPWGFPSAWRLAWINACPLALWSSNNGNGSSDICGYTHCKLSFAIAMLTYLRVVRYALYRLGITWFIKGIMKHKPTSNCTITPTKTERVTIPIQSNLPFGHWCYECWKFPSYIHSGDDVQPLYRSIVFMWSHHVTLILLPSHCYLKSMFVLIVSELHPRAFATHL